MTVEERRRRRFSESFRKEQVELIVSGELNIKEVSLLYEVKISSIKRWIRKYNPDFLPNQIVISNGAEIARIKELEKDIEKLKQIIADQQISIITKDALVRLAKGKLGDLDEKK